MFKNRIWIFTLSLILGDIFSFCFSFILIYYIRFKTGIFSGFAPISNFLPIISYSAILLVIISHFFNLYTQKRALFDLSEFTSILKSVTIVFLLTILTTFLYKISQQFSRVTITFTFLLSFVLIVISRIILRKILGKLRTKGFNRRRALILGETKLGKLINLKAKQLPELGYKIIKFTELKNFEKDLKESKATVVFITLPRKNDERLNEIILSHNNITFKFVPNILETISDPIDVSEFPNIPLITVKEKQHTHYPKIKNLFDPMAASMILLFIIPLIISIYTFNCMLYSRPIYTHIRLGKNLIPFTLYKFRTMKEGNRPKNESNYLFKAKNDPRITKFGKILRRTCLDELPQLFNVIKGEMSLVGPRPHLKEELRFFKGWRKKRFQVKPGLTGLWQISGRHELSLDKTVALDLYYIKHLSFINDIKILLKTIPAILFSRGKW